MSAILHVSKDKDTVGHDVATWVKQLAEQAVEKSGVFTVALSGGSMPKILATGLLAMSDKMDFNNWHVYFSDERCVALDHDDSNFKASNDALLSKVPIPKDQIYTIDPSLSPAQSAEAYSKLLQKRWGAQDLPAFDLILLGMGPDGHTCSLFPNHPLLDENESWVAFIEDSPKPPPQRITLTYPVLNNAANVAFIACGAKKADLLPCMLKDEVTATSLPAARVRPKTGGVHWFVDEPAAVKVSASL